MKRQAAIMGPTPAFIAWSIRLPCDLKTDVADEDPQSIERALRAIRRVSEAVDEDRTVNGLAYEMDDATIRVCSIEEISRAFGGWSHIEQSCASCPANLEAPDVLAGCFGWLTIEDIDSQLLEKLATRQRELRHEFEIEMTDPAWFGMWHQPSFQGEILRVFAELFGTLLADSGGNPSLKQFVAALRVCYSRNMILDIHSFPSGYSDGVCWKIASHCPNCLAAMSPSSLRCQTCHRNGAAHPPIKRKVRGHRPFVALEERFDSIEADRLRLLIEAKAHSIEQN